MIPQQIVIKRLWENKYQTLGELRLYNNKEELFKAKTLELPWRDNQRRISRIPANHYNAVTHQSPKHGNVIWIQGVPNRTEILIHKGNVYTDTLGCILVGEDHVDIDDDGYKDVTNSIVTMNKLYSLVKDPVYVNIIEEL